MPWHLQDMACGIRIHAGTACAAFGRGKQVWHERAAVLPRPDQEG